MGDWGYFPTPRAGNAVLAQWSIHYSRMKLERVQEAFVLGYSYQHDLAAVETGMNRTTQQIYMPQAQTGILPLEKKLAEWQGEVGRLLGKSAHSDSIFVRFVVLV